jgi:hypothetical protein
MYRTEDPALDQTINPDSRTKVLRVLNNILAKVRSEGSPDPDSKIAHFEREQELTKEIQTLSWLMRLYRLELPPDARKLGSPLRLKRRRK